MRELLSTERFWIPKVAYFVFQPFQILIWSSYFNAAGFSLGCGAILSFRPPISSVSHLTQAKTRLPCKEMVKFLCSLFMKQNSIGE